MRAPSRSHACAFPPASRFPHLLAFSLKRSPLAPATRPCRSLRSHLELPPLPALPSLAGPSFEIPTRLLPWGVQKWEQLGEQSAAPSNQQVAVDADSDWGSLAIGASAGMAGVLMVTGLAVGAKRICHHHASSNKL